MRPLAILWTWPSHRKRCWLSSVYMLKLEARSSTSVRCQECVLSRPQVDLTFQRFRFLAPCQRLRAIVCVLSAHLRDDESSNCVCLRLREQCLRSELTSVARVAHVLLLRLFAGNMDVNTLASKRPELIGNTAIVRIPRVIHNKSTCVCLRLSVAAFTRKRKDARFDLWPDL